MWGWVPGPHGCNAVVAELACNSKRFAAIFAQALLPFLPVVNLQILAMPTLEAKCGGCVLLDVRTVMNAWNYYVNYEVKSSTPPTDAEDDDEPLVVAPQFIDMSVEMPFGKRCRTDASYRSQ